MFKPTPTLRQMIDAGKINEVPRSERDLLYHANERALMDLSIAVMRAEGSPDLELIESRSRLATRPRMN
jgi:hypothetical protein